MRIRFCQISLLISGLVLVSITSIYGQTRNRFTDRYKQGIALGYIWIGGNAINVNSLNKSLDNIGYSKHKGEFFDFGMGMTGNVKGLILGGEGFSISGIRRTENNVKSRILGACGFFNFGYVLLSNKRMRFYPMVGLGFGGIKLTVEKSTYEWEQPFPGGDPVLEENISKYEYKAAGYLVNLSLGYDMMFESMENLSGVTGGFILGFRLGYILAPFLGEWEFDGINPKNVPDPYVRITGPYFSIIFGAGHRSS